MGTRESTAEGPGVHYRRLVDRIVARVPLETKTRPFPRPATDGTKSFRGLIRHTTGSGTSSTTLRAETPSTATTRGDANGIGPGSTRPDGTSWPHRPCSVSAHPLNQRRHDHGGNRDLRDPVQRSVTPGQARCSRRWPPALPTPTWLFERCLNRPSNIVSFRSSSAATTTLPSRLTGGNPAGPMRPAATRR